MKKTPTVSEQTKQIVEMTETDYTPITGYKFECHNDYTHMGSGTFTVTSGGITVEIDVEMTGSSVRFNQSFSTDQGKTRRENFAVHSLLMNVWGNLETLNQTLI